jgi:hypothetical protein
MLDRAARGKCAGDVGPWPSKDKIDPYPANAQFSNQTGELASINIREVHLNEFHKCYYPDWIAADG